MAQHLLTASQVAERLGVRPQTVYAYVSRGILRRTVSLDGRTSLFDPGPVEELARRGRPRVGRARPGAVDVVLATAVTRLAEDELRYRGHDAAQLAATSTYEDVAELLWTGRLGSGTSWPLDLEAADLAAAAARSLRPGAPVELPFAAATAAVAAAAPLRGDLRPASIAHHARVLIGALAGCLPPVEGARTDRAGAAPASVAARLWPALSPLRPTPARLRLVDATLVLLADHELATSTLAARVAASTRAGPHAVVLAGLGAMAGPLHGGAAPAAQRLLVEAAASGTEGAAARALEEVGHLPGFGHAVYRGVDPRAAVLLDLLAEVAPARQLAVVDEVRAMALAEAGLEANIDLALGALAVALRVPPGRIGAVFILPRVAGWVAHALEELEEAPLRFRVRAVYASGDPAG